MFVCYIFIFCFFVFEGYMLFMGDQREILRQTNAGLAFHEITKLVAQRWAQLDASEKNKYLEAAEADKERYE